MKKEKRSLFGISGLALFLFPAIGRAQIVSCNVCTLADVPVVLNNLITYLAMLSIPVAVAAYAYGGFMLVLSPASESNKNKGKEVMINTTWGVAIVFTAYIIVKLLVVTLGLGGSWVT